MRHSGRWALGLGNFFLLALVLSCSGAGSDALLGTGNAGLTATASFGVRGEIPVQEGLALGADPEEIRLDPCDPAQVVDPDTGKMLGKSTLGAFLRDAELQPIVGAEVIFSATAGLLESMGQPVLTDERGLATDSLTVDEDDAGEIVVTATAGDLVEMLTLPVIVVPKPQITLTMRPDELWPPNHRMRLVDAVFEGLDCYPETTVRLVSVTSDEPDDGTGDGDTEGDIQNADLGTPDTRLMLRAERAGGGDGRVYTVLYELIDDAGAISTLEATVAVPHDQGH